MNSRKKNFFDLPLFSPFDVFKQNSFSPSANLIIKQFRKLEGDLKLPKSSLIQIIQEIKKLPNTDISNERTIMEAFHKKFPDFSKNENVKALLQNRAKMASDLLYPLICESISKDDGKVNVLDYGCGQGIIGFELSKKEKIADLALLDIADYRYEEVKNEVKLPFFLRENVINRNHIIPFSIDCIILHTVLHHTHNPDDVINHCIDLFGNRPGYIIVVESSVHVPADLLNEDCTSEDRQFCDLNNDQQMAYTIFLDWFFCKILSENINVTYTFHRYLGNSAHNGQQDWNTYLNQFENLEVEDHACWGFLPSCPTSFHTMHLCKVN